VSNLIIASQFNLNPTSLTNKLLSLVEEGWIDDSPSILLPVNRVRDITANTIAKVAVNFNLTIHEYHALWQCYDEPCQIRYNGFGKYNALAGNTRNLLMANDCTHALIIWNGEDRDLNELIRILKINGKHLQVELVHV